MKIIVAEHAGFCFGVTKAVETVYEQIGKKSNLYTYGPIIHNESVVADLERKNVKVVNTPEELAEIRNGTIVIRSSCLTLRYRRTVPQTVKISKRQLK